MRIRPFRGYRYTRDRARDLSAVVAPPYDQIGFETQDRIHGMSPWNIAWITYPKVDAGADRYDKARAVLDVWLASGAWARDAAPAIYPYHQTYPVAGQPVTRMGFIALGEVTEYRQGMVRPHERTHAGPKRDRLRLLEATGADTGLLFLLVSDADGALRTATAMAGDSLAQARDLRGELHRLWRVTDPAVIEHVQRLMAPRPVVIADGHHRYETAVEYARRHPDAGWKLMAFFPLEAPGLTILPNHRLVHDLPGFSLDRLSKAAEGWFDVSPLPDPVGFQPASRQIGVVAGADAAVLTPRPDGLDRFPWPAGRSRAWRELPVSILHEGLLRPCLGITDEQLDARTHVDYTADQAEAVRLVRADRYQAAFLIAPPTPEQLLAVVQAGELLPQKSTHFYPKLLDGLVFHRFDEVP